MRTIIKKRSHYWTRLPLGLLLIIFFAFSPLLIGILGSWLTERSTGEPCHEGNCGWMVLPWLTVLTLPIGSVGLLIFGIQVLKDASKRKRKTEFYSGQPWQKRTTNYFRQR